MQSFVQNIAPFVLAAYRKHPVDKRHMVYADACKQCPDSRLRSSEPFIPCGGNLHIRLRTSMPRDLQITGTCTLDAMSASPRARKPRWGVQAEELEVAKEHRSKAKRCTLPSCDLMHALSKLSRRLKRLPWALDRNWVYHRLLSLTEGRLDLLFRDVNNQVMGSGYTTNRMTLKEQEVALASSCVSSVAAPLC